METRKDLYNKKMKQIESVVQEGFMKMSLSGDNKKIVQDLLECNCLNVTSPQQEPPRLCYITVDSFNDYHHGNTIKPGNIRINIKILIDKIPEIIADSVSIISDIDILKICAVISIWKMLRDISTIELKKEQAIVIVALWKKCNRKHMVSLEDGYRNANMLCKQIDENEFTWEQYISIIEELEKIECIELNNDGIWLCEWVSRKYEDS